MFDHIGFNVGDFDRSLAFYWAVLAPLGIGVLDPDGHNVEAVTTAPEA